MNRRSSRRGGPFGSGGRFLAIALLVASCVALVGSTSWAHTDPFLCVGGTNDLAACTDAADCPGGVCTPPGGGSSGLAGLFAWRDPAGTVPVVGTVLECETIYLQAVLSYVINPFPGFIGPAFEGGAWSMRLPDGTIVDLTPPSGVPCIGGTTDDPASPGGRGLCAGAPTSIASGLVPYTVRPADVVAGRIRVIAAYGDRDPHSPRTAYLHWGANDTPGVSASVPLVIPVRFCARAETECSQADRCDAEREQCVRDDRPDGTPCTDTVPDCWIAGCEAGVCVQSHAPVPPDTPELCNGIDDNCNGQTDEDSDGEDSDGDGIRNACDNCDSAPNPDQADLDADGLGDACDGCPTEYDPRQEDRNGDRVGDLCDLDDGVILIRFTDPSYVEWQEEAGFTGWNVYAGDLDELRGTGVYTQLPGSNPLAARRCRETAPWASGFDTPPSGETLFFLVTGVQNGVEGSLGPDSRGVERPNANACP